MKRNIKTKFKEFTLLYNDHQLMSLSPFEREAIILFPIQAETDCSAAIYIHDQLINNDAGYISKYNRKTKEIDIWYKVLGVYRCETRYKLIEV